jgi:phosphatidylglycerol---prolipoprotein diacylglyceryl transferase
MFSADPHFVHRIDPVLLSVCSIDTYYYGLAYTLGLLGVYLWFYRRRSELGWSAEQGVDLSIALVVCVLIFGRAFEIIVYEWGYYSQHPSELLSYWHGGMASHGVLLGGVIGAWIFSHRAQKSFLQILDELAIPAALFLALGRIGNFVNGQIFGHATDVWWAVKFPDAEGFRHPVALYESLKNFAIVPVLLLVRRGSHSGEGLLLAHFVFWYGFLRLFTDYYREYGNEVFGIGTGQYFNLFMAAFGLGLIIWRTRVHRRGQGVVRRAAEPPPSNHAHLFAKRVVFVALLLFCLTIPSSWTQGVLVQYREKQRTQAEAVQPARADQY